MEKSKSEKQKQLGNSLNTYARYSSLAFQMMAILLLFVFAGYKLDSWTEWHFPLFKLLFSLLGVVLAIYFAVKDFLKKP